MKSSLQTKFQQKKGKVNEKGHLKCRAHQQKKVQIAKGQVDDEQRSVGVGGHQDDGNGGKGRGEEVEKERGRVNSFC